MCSFCVLCHWIWLQTTFFVHKTKRREHTFRNWPDRRSHDWNLQFIGSEPPTHANAHTSCTCHLNFKCHPISVHLIRAGGRQMRLLFSYTGPHWIMCDTECCEKRIRIGMPMLTVCLVDRSIGHSHMGARVIWAQFEGMRKQFPAWIERNGIEIVLLRTPKIRQRGINWAINGDFVRRMH